MISTLKVHYNLQVQVVQTKMNRIITHFFYAAFLVLFGVQCSNSQYDIQENEKLLKEYVRMLSEDDYPVFHQTMSKEKVSEYIGEGFLLEEVFFIPDRPDSLNHYFNDEVVSNFIDNVGGYRVLDITEELTKGHRVVTNEEIPEFVKDRNVPLPFNYSGFTNVLFISTPIISNNRAILIHDTYGSNGVGIGISFFMKKNQDNTWKLYASGSVHKLSFYSD